MRIAAVGALYPVDIVEDGGDSPHRNPAGIGAELYVGFGAHDGASPPEKSAAFRSELDRAKLTHEVEVFEDAGHGFQFAERYDDSYSPAAAEASWSKLFALWRRRLVKPDCTTGARLTHAFIAWPDQSSRPGSSGQKLSQVPEGPRSHSLVTRAME
jgi:hypothetical protein